MGFLKGECFTLGHLGIKNRAFYADIKKCKYIVNLTDKMPSKDVKIQKRKIEILKKLLPLTPSCCPFTFFDTFF
jgi:hypothetical protein